MYAIDEHDRVVELTDVPRSAVGAPLPLVLASDFRLTLLYVAEAVERGWSGQTVRSVSPRSADEIVVRLEFTRPVLITLARPTTRVSATILWRLAG